MYKIKTNPIIASPKMKEVKNMNSIIKDYIDDNKWMFPYIDSSLYTNYNYSQICNEDVDFP